MGLPAIEIRDLRKSYGDLEAVKGIDLEVAAGEVFALVGPNGAGKTSIVEICEGYRARTAGEVRVLGFDPARGGPELKARIGIVLQETGIDPYLTVDETIDRFRGYYPRPSPRDEIVDVVGLQDKRDVRVGKLSGGQQRRLDVAIGLAGDPELLFLDEPTTGFDPNARRNAWGMIKSLRSLGKTVLLTTHYMDEAEQLADRVAIIVGGEIVAEGPPGSLASAETNLTRVTFRLPTGSPPLPPGLTKGAGGDGRVTLRVEDPMRTLHELTGWGIEHGVQIEELTVSRPSLEDVYLDLTAAAEQRARRE
jgi:ABC-2 type transport system ATP-binding protein